MNFEDVAMEQARHRVLIASKPLGFGFKAHMVVERLDACVFQREESRA
jgi:hypothetical protein